MDDPTYVPEWQRILIAPSGEHLNEFDSGWYRDERVVRCLLNREYPEPTSTGFRHVLQTRMVSEARIVE